LLLLTQKELSQAAQQAGLLTHMAVAGSYNSGRRDIMGQETVLAIGLGPIKVLDGVTHGMQLFNRTKKPANQAGQ
jgi:hypothetical protein